MTRLEREVRELGPRTPDDLLAAARRFMNRTEPLETMMRELIATSRLDPFFRPPFHPLPGEAQHGLLLYHHPDLSISLGVPGVDMLAARGSGRSAPASVDPRHQILPSRAGTCYKDRRWAVVEGVDYGEE
jgi:hypothetical protein